MSRFETSSADQTGPPHPAAAVDAISALAMGSAAQGGLAPDSPAKDQFALAEAAKDFVAIDGAADEDAANDGAAIDWAAHDGAADIGAAKSVSAEIGATKVGGDLDCSGFLGGRLRIWQPRSGYRGGIDPVLLAAATPAKPGQSVLELGLGAGTASLCLGARVAGLCHSGVELQAYYARLAQRNAAENGTELEIFQADIAALPSGLKMRSFDHVIANPPYFRPEGRSQAADSGREIGRGEQRPLGDWVTTALKRLHQGGVLTLIQVMPRLPDLMQALPLGGTTVQPFAARAGREADRLILWHRKGGRSAFRLLPTLVLHEGPAHLRDGDDYAPWARDVLRHGAALPSQG